MLGCLQNRVQILYSIDVLSHQQKPYPSQHSSGCPHAGYRMGVLMYSHGRCINGNGMELDTVRHMCVSRTGDDGSMWCSTRDPPVGVLM